MLKPVDGPVGIIMPKLATWRIRIADSRSIHTTFPSMQAQIYFLEYRLEVVRAWPESARKQATIAAILSQLERHAHS